LDRYSTNIKSISVPAIHYQNCETFQRLKLIKIGLAIAEEGGTHRYTGEDVQTDICIQKYVALLLNV
jgi:hypothetical protein